MELDSCDDRWYAKGWFLILLESDRRNLKTIDFDRTLVYLNELNRSLVKYS